MKKKLLHIVLHPYFPVLLLVSVNIVIGLLVAADYSESWDEHLRYLYAKRSLVAYFGERQAPQDEKGAFYVMIAKMGSDLLSQSDLFKKLNLGWHPIDAWHFMHFLSFQVAIFFLYDLCLRYVGKAASIAATLMFATQPLLWGHAFINPKDIPFMAFFLASVATGLRMADAILQDCRPVNFIFSRKEASSLASMDWDRARGRKRKALAIIVGISAFSLLALLLLWVGIRPILYNLLEQAMSGQSNTWLQALVPGLASNVSLDSYVQKGVLLYQRFLLYFSLAVIGCNLGILTAWIFPAFARYLWHSFIPPFLVLVRASITNWRVWLAGIFLGLSASIRVVGPFAGILIACYLLWKSRRKSPAVLMVYFLIAFLVTYITWPNLWGAPLKNFIASFKMASDFPWEGRVMFAGIDYAIGELPRSYLLVLLSIQLTLPAVLTILSGAVLAIYHGLKNRPERPRLALILGWFLLPVIAAVIAQPTMYDNFRQFLFVLPPLFVLISITFQELFDRVKWKSLAVLVIVLLLTPNFIWLQRLHPYEYVYYNAFVGNVQGAFRHYEMDYWATSYRDATEYLNQYAPYRSRVIVWGPDHIVESYARRGLKIEPYQKNVDLSGDLPTYAVILTRHDKDLSLFEQAPVVFQVGRSGGIFAVVKQLSPTDNASP